MRASTRALLPALAASLLLSACSGSGGASGRKVFRENLGTHTVNNLLQYSEQALLTTYSYRYQRAETASPDNIFLQTEWKDVTPTEDELALGIQFVRAQITVTARTSNRTTGDVRARFEGEAEYRRQGMLEWIDAPMTAQREAYFEDIVDYLERELHSAWRE